ncbi:hypothetical protein CDCA_CDCA14G3786 [Cyanidium caldarium]|uniref:Glycosyl hydrolase family 13 catalytic domain-containing protein n=1 Tax=Cyanidium caldarium TaxID=2771 RepID=A0AAV9J0F0_CYACA|nr:hypothetical protein CDCA_CDCA14G3786 [Cyanidium caldarium]
MHRVRSRASFSNKWAEDLVQVPPGLELDDEALRRLERQRRLEGERARHDHGNVALSISRRLAEWAPPGGLVTSRSLSALLPGDAQWAGRAEFGRGGVAAQGLAERVSRRDERLVQGLAVRRGHPLPYGVTLTPEGTNFAIFAMEEESVALLLYPVAMSVDGTPRRLPWRMRRGHRGPTTTAAPVVAPTAVLKPVAMLSPMQQQLYGMTARHELHRSVSSPVPSLSGHEDTDDDDRYDDVHSSGEDTSGTPRADSAEADDGDSASVRDGALRREDSYVSPLRSETVASIDSRATRPTVDTSRPIVIELDPLVHRTGQVWHVQIAPNVEHYGYAWRIGRTPTRWGSNVALDPYAKCLYAPTVAQYHYDAAPYRPVCGVPGIGELDFDWDGVLPPLHHFKDLIIYEMHVRGLTVNTDSPSAGTFLGVIDAIPYLQSLGINAVELMPACEFNENEWDLKNPLTGEQLCQYWGYSPVALFAPMTRYATAPLADAVRQFKLMVRELHRAGIEVIVDVVFNHTAEFGEDGPPPRFYHFKALAPHTYYLFDKQGGFANYSGCGNTLNANHVATAEFVHECVRYWALEMGVDGFRFDLAAALCRDTEGQPMAAPPLIERLSLDPCLRHLKLIAEPWDLGQYLVGHFPHYGCWAEWNGRYRDTVRRFIGGEPHLVGDFATRLCGSEDLYANGRQPWHSINFVTAHDGFTLYDLVAYAQKHNEGNGEGNQDGESHNNSNNCGFEGDGTRDEQVYRLRQKQMRNFFVALLLSVGTPMLLMGDEYGHSRGGNNNAWCQDNALNHFDWAAAGRDDRGLLRFVRLLIRFRRSHAFLNRYQFVTRTDVQWVHADWHEAYNYLVMRLVDGERSDDVLVGFNAGAERRTVSMPPLPDGRKWVRVVDTNLTPPADIADGNPVSTKIDSTYVMQPWSALVLQSRRPGMSAVNLHQMVE